MKRVQRDSITVHVLSLDGTLSVHATQRNAIVHYIETWMQSLRTDDAFWKRFEDADLDEATKSVMKKALKENGLSREHVEIDFAYYLEQCEDVCFYEELEMKL